MRHKSLGSADLTGIAQDWLVKRIAARLGTTEAEVPVDCYIDELDIESADALAIVVELEEWIGEGLDITSVWHHPTIADLSEWLAREYGDALRM